ncbi:MAG: hypothetical protein LUD27_02515 [Clostridia bacterium]|nr:hypothetical protein [Clostridia bacterium]
MENANLIVQREEDAEQKTVSEEEWQEERDKKLIDMFNDVTVGSMAQELSRTENAVRNRLVKLGLIMRRSDIV